MQNDMLGHRHSAELVGYANCTYCFLSFSLYVFVSGTKFSCYQSEIAYILFITSNIFSLSSTKRMENCNTIV